MSRESGPFSQAAWDRWNRRALPAYWLFLFCATHLPALQLPEVAPSDKLAHFVAYGLLAFLFWRFCEALSRPLSAYFIWIAATVLIAYAVFDEFLQTFTGRTAGLVDGVCDAAGVVVVLGVLEWLRRKGIRRSKSASRGGKALDSASPKS